MKVTVLGKSPSWQDASGACSGYLVEHDDFAVLLDCGSGAFGALRERRDYLAVDAVLITHLHADHFLDLIPFASAIAFGPRGAEHGGGALHGGGGALHGGGGRHGNGAGPGNGRPRLYAPPGSGDAFRRIGSIWRGERLVEGVFDLREYEEADALHLGPFTVRFREVPHYVVTYAVELAAGGRRLTFGADCSPNDGLVEFATGTDLLLIESTLVEPERDGDRGHLTAAEAGDHARRAGAKATVLTHFSDEIDPERLKREGEAALGGPLSLAVEGASYEL